MSNQEPNTVVTGALAGRRIAEMSAADYLKAVAQATAGLNEPKSMKRGKRAALSARSTTAK